VLVLRGHNLVVAKARIPLKIPAVSIRADIFDIIPVNDVEELFVGAAPTVSEHARVG
jgi:hypothetical protein